MSTRIITPAPPRSQVAPEHKTQIGPVAQMHRSAGLKTYVCKAGEEIESIDDDEPGRGDAVLFTINKNGSLEEWKTEAGETITETVYNLSSAPISEDRYFVVYQDLLSGKLIVGSPIGYKPWCNFILDYELTSSDDDQDATIQSQWGLGVDNEEDITVHNMGTSETDTYLFSGDSGDKGLAAWRGDGTNYVIIQMECP